MDATEKEAAAREVVLRGIVNQMNAAMRAVGSDAEAVLQSSESTNLDAYRAAIESRVRAELAAKVRWLPRWVYTEDAMEAAEYGNWLKRDDALAQMERGA